MTKNCRSRPIVILAGWLGCHPKNLQRHVQMYDRLGYTSLIRIASPESVLHAMVDGPPAPNTHADDEADGNDRNNMCSSESEHIAINTLQHIQKLQPPHFIIHIFSNNGCFLWEWIRYILFHKSSYNLQDKLIGTIFDSAPAYFHGKIDGLQSALEYVGNKEQRDNLIYLARSLNPNLVKRRHNEFWNGLRDDIYGSGNVPQLYLYSDDDPLTNVTYLEELIAHRRQQISRKERIWSHKFVSSSHCGHLKSYPAEYEHFVGNFLEFCTATDGCKRSRL
ncbi:hypothetical protein ACHAWT_004391 [Skeletonema menzelii]